MNAFKDLLWAIVFIVGLSLALDVTGIDLSSDYDGKQVIEQLECQNKGGILTTRNSGTLYQQSLMCEGKNEHKHLH